MQKPETEIIILCYGDSNTRGSIPCILHGRYSRDIRWPGRLQKLLGKDFYVIEEGLGGRTTSLDDPGEEGRNGKTFLLPCLRSHRPIDLVILMLGTNDLKAQFSETAEEIAQRAGQLVSTIQHSQAGKGNGDPLVLLIAPPPLGKLTAFEAEFAGGIEKSHQFGSLYWKQADLLGCEFLDAGKIIRSSDKDGLHWEAEEHLKLAAAVGAQIQHLHFENGITGEAD
jgi:lysophospholipase L1-like esterase